MEIYTNEYLQKLLFPLLTMPLLYLFANFYYLYPGRMIITNRQKAVYPKNLLPLTKNGYHIRVFSLLIFWSVILVILYWVFLLPRINLLIFAKFHNISTNTNTFEEQVGIALKIQVQATAGISSSIFINIIISFIHYKFLSKRTKSWLTKEYLENWSKEKDFYMQKHNQKIFLAPRFEKSILLFFARYVNNISLLESKNELTTKYLSLATFLHRVYLLTLCSKKTKRQEWMLYYYSLALKKFGTFN